MLDVGTGTGVLAIAAKRLGACRTVAVDLDSASVFTAARNLRLNAIPRNGEESTCIQLAVGTVDAVKGIFDLVVANLAAPTLLRIATDLAAHTGALLVLSGITEGMRDSVFDHYGDDGLELMRELSQDGWHGVSGVVRLKIRLDNESDAGEYLWILRPCRSAMESGRRIEIRVKISGRSTQPESILRDRRVSAVKVFKPGGAWMADYYINIFLDADKLSKLDGVGLAGQVQEIEGKKAIQVPVNAKEHKKLSKSFPDMAFDASNAAVLPAAAEETLLGFVTSMKNLDVMKVAISKLFSPLAGKELRTKTY